MQSIEIKRFATHRIAIAAAVAIGAIAGGLVSTGALSDVTGDSDGRSRPVSQSAERPAYADTAGFLEWHTNPPALSAGPVQSAEENAFLEMNTLLPGQAGLTAGNISEARLPKTDTVTPTVPSVSEMRFLEMNLYLPGSSSTVTPSTAPHWKVIEDNSWGEDFVFDSPAMDSYYPSADDVPQLSPGQVRF